MAQIGVFVEFDRLCDVADRKNYVLDRRAAAIEAGTDVLANLFDLACRSPLPTTLPPSSRATWPPTATKWPPSRNATLVVGGEVAHGGPTISGAGKSLTTSSTVRNPP